MAVYYNLTSYAWYSFSGVNYYGTETDIRLGGDALDDGTWDVGDPELASNSNTYRGYFESGGQIFLVFHGNPQGYTLIASPTASLDDYPDTFLMGDIELNTEPLPVCFAKGTFIDTPRGERRVEALQIGDQVRTSDGGVATVKWIGRQTLHKVVTRPERFEPVRVCAGALGYGVPHTDLVLTADHALILDGLAINASALVNGTTIRYEPRDSLPERVTYYHVETEDHDVILANGAGAETFIDYVDRAAFDNHDEYLALYGSEVVVKEMPMPRISAARLLPAAIRARLRIVNAA